MKTLSDWDIERLWDRFQEISMDKEKRIEVPFHIWDSGTSKEIIESWFDFHHSQGLSWLAHPQRRKIERKQIISSIFQELHQLKEPITTMDLEDHFFKLALSSPLIELLIQHIGPPQANLEYWSRFEKEICFLFDFLDELETRP